ncbi:MAG: fimbrial biogenesis chaperone, partial [Sphingomicrobium sp.]
PDGEYRVHMLFRAIPPATPVVQPAGEAPKGVQFKLTPIYGVTIPVIVRLGYLQAAAGIANVQLEKKPTGPAVGFDITRTGTRSTYGEVRVLKAGVKDPIAFEKGVAVYTEIGMRHVSVPVADTYKGDLSGPVTVEYLETTDDGSHLLAQTQAVLR